MGKGKGKFIRFMYRVTPYKPIIFFPKLSKIRLNTLFGDIGGSYKLKTF